MCEYNSQFSVKIDLFHKQNREHLRNFKKYQISKKFKNFAKKIIKNFLIEKNMKIYLFFTSGKKYFGVKHVLNQKTIRKGKND